MPFRSQAQWRWAFATGQEWADEWAKMTPGGKRKFLLLQKRVGTSKAIESLKHLPGKHDQSKHGRDGGGGGGISGGSGVSNARVQARVDEHFDGMIERINSVKYLDESTAINLESAIKISNMSEEEQIALLDSPRLVGDGFTMSALVLYGTPKVRDRAVQMTMIDDVNQNQYITRLSTGTVFSNAWYTASEFSLEGKEVSSKLNNESFVESLWFMHGTKIEGIQTAQWQMVMSQVGPNADVPLTRTFFQPGIKPPEPQPRYVQMMNQEYQRTQEELARRGVTEVQLYRSSAYEPGIPLEPWTTEKNIADGFGKLYRQQTGQKIVQRKAKIPARYILSTWDIAPGWPENYVVGKREHMIAGQAYARDTGASTKKDFALLSNKPGYGIGKDPFNYDALYDFLPIATRKKAISERRTAVALKHLPGRHNQQAHGRRGGASGGSASAFTTWNDREVAKMNQDLRDIVSADPVTYSAEQKRDMSSYLQFYVPVVLPNIVLDRLQRDGIPFDAAMQLLKNKKNALTKMVETKTPIDMKQLYLEQRIQLHYREQNVRFSRLTKEEQDAVFSKLKDRVAAKDPTLTHDDMDMLVTAGLYGHPQMRMDAYKTLVDAKPLSINKRQIEGENGLYTRVDGSETKLSNALGTYEYYSLDYRMMNSVPSFNNAQGNLSRMPTSGDAFNQDVDFFMRAFTRTHVMENTENVLGAAIQSHMSQVGPNADAPRPPSFYPRGVKTPETNPVIVSYLQEQYRQTQAELSASGTTSTQLYRGTASDFRLGIPMSPWSDTKSVSMRFGDVLNQATIPNKYVFMNHLQDRFNKTFVGENEWLMLETGMMGKTRRKPIAGIPYMGGTKIKPAYELTVKAMRDIPFAGSLLEQQYDIFYNFREKPTKKRQKSMDSHIPPASVRASAKRGLELRSEFGRGGTAIGIARARDLSNGKGISSSTIKRMVSFFARHAVDKRPDWANPSKPSNGYIAHLLWGGDSGRSWANKISRQINAERTKADDVTADGKPKRYSAGGGEVITGNLGRDSSGRFTNIRGAQALTQRIITRGDGPKKKRGGGRAKLSPEQAKAQRDKIGKDTIKKFGFSSDDYDALSTISDDPISVDSADTESVKKLIESNLAEVVGDVVALTTLGKRVLKVSQSGKAGAVREVIARDAAKRDAQNKKRAEQNQSRVDKLNEQIASYEDKIADKKTKPRTRAIAERKLARAKAKLAELTTTKSRLKHLPGKHNQQSHGRDGGGGGGGISGGSGVSDSVKQIADYRAAIQPFIDSNEYQPIVAARFEASRIISTMDEQTQLMLVNDDFYLNGVTLTALATFGTPIVRDIAAKKYYDKAGEYVDWTSDEQPYSTFNRDGKRIDETWVFMQRNSLEYKELVRQSRHATPTAEFLWDIHAAGETGLHTAQIQMALSNVGPNADVPRSAIRSFYPDGITPPQPQPRYVTALEQTYIRTQEELARQGITTVNLHRGSDLAPGLPLEPWTPLKRIATKFANFYNQGRNRWAPKIVVRSAKIPAKYMLATWRTAEGWDEEGVVGKQEHMVAGLAYANDTGLLTTKAYAMKSSPAVVDLMTYDIYFNYRLKPTKPTTTRTKAITDRRTAVKLKHLPGKHDQSKHGRDGGGGRGGISGGFSRGSSGSGNGKANPYGLKFDAPTADAPNPISLESLTLDSPLVQAAIKLRLQDDINMNLLAIRKEADLIETQTGIKYTGIRDTVEHAMFIRETAKNAGLTATVHESILSKDPRVLAIDGVSGQAFQAIVYDALGYNERPRLVGNDELSNLTGVKTNNNGRPLIHYRGVEPNLIFSLDGEPTQLTAQDIMDDFTNGKVHYVGRGVDGNGTYMAYNAKSSDDNSTYSNARGYAGNNGVVFATAVKETAKIGTEEQYKSAVRNSRNPKNDDEVFATYFWDSMNAGTRMALLGWDGYTPDNVRFVLLNRGVVITGRTAVTEPIQ